MTMEERAKVSHGKIRTILIVAVGVVVLAAAAMIVYGLPPVQFQRALALMEKGDYASARAIFAAQAESNAEATHLAIECAWREGLAKYCEGKHEEADAIFAPMYRGGAVPPDYVQEGMRNYWVELAQKHIDAGQYQEAFAVVAKAYDSDVVEERVCERIYQKAVQLSEKDPMAAADAFRLLVDYGYYKDCKDQLYQIAVRLSQGEDPLAAVDILLQLGDYKGAKEYLQTHYVQTIATENVYYYNFDSYEGKTVYSGSHHMIYTYDSDGNVIRKADADTIYEYTYDDGVLVGEYWQQDGISYRITFQYEYDATGRLVKKSEIYTEEINCSAANVYWTYTYDADGKLLTETKLRENSNGDNYRWHYRYDENGRLVAATVDKLGLKGELSIEAIYSFQYVYDEQGRLILEENEQGPLNTHLFGLDTKRYEYDKNGNLTRMTCWRVDTKTRTKYIAVEYTYTYEWTYRLGIE